MKVEEVWVWRVFDEFDDFELLGTRLCTKLREGKVLEAKMVLGDVLGTSWGLP